ncbi:TPA: hypothetical protein ACTW9I_003396, partial [Raoultella planticola]
WVKTEGPPGYMTLARGDFHHPGCGIADAAHFYRTWQPPPFSSFSPPFILRAVFLTDNKK